MATKLIIIKKEGDRQIVGRSAFVEIDGKQISGEINSTLNMPLDGVITANVELVIDGIEERAE